MQDETGKTPPLSQDPEINPRAGEVPKEPEAKAPAKAPAKKAPAKAKK